MIWPRNGIKFLVEYGVSGNQIKAQANLQFVKTLSD